MDQALPIHHLTLSIEKKNMKSNLFLNIENKAKDINTLSNRRVIHWQMTSGNPQKVSPMRIKSYLNTKSTNSNKQTERFISPDHPSV